ncbi:MFS transporter [Bacillus sp. 165]|uniref:MFS transporter n=1 Tax=Bacillus sp. 165 TaxID=1529117 RepID=UPI001ADA367E|nr:MFS transporter [Bacillus sp. 165]MBO9129389.1 MFS transporter [Bacillus sp. 165]
MSQNNNVLESRTVQKVTTRIIPFLFILYIVAFLDRSNLSYAALEMNKELGLTAEVFGLVAGIFFIGYAFLEIPSNIILYRTGARKWIARIMLTWGFVVILTAWVQSATHLYILRFLLGVAEAGFFPGVILYLTFWFRAKERARAIALFMTSVAVSNIVGAPVSTWIMDNIQWFGLSGWRWMFILEGIPAIILGVITWFYLTDRPEQAKWLTEDEKRWLNTELKKENEEKLSVKQSSTREVLKDSRVWLLTFVYLFYLLGAYGLTFWTPTIIKSISASYTNTQVGLLAMIPAIIGLIAMIWWARQSDRTGERWIHTAVTLIVSAGGLIGSGLAYNPIVSILMLAVAFAGAYSFFGPFWSLPSLFLTESSAAVGIALVNSIGALGGFFGPVLVGLLETDTALFVLSASFFVSLIPLFAIRKKMLIHDNGAKVQLENINKAN